MSAFPAEQIGVLYVQHRPDLGGPPTSLVNLIRGLDRERYRASVFCPDGPVVEFFLRSGVPVYTGPVATFTHVDDSIYRGARWAMLGYEFTKLGQHRRALRRAIRETEARIVHLNESTLGPAAYLSHRWGCKVVWHVRKLIAGGARGDMIRGWMRRWADAVVAIDEDVADGIVGLQRTHVIHNSVDIDAFAPNGRGARIRSDLGISRGQVCVAMVGRLRPSKGTFDFIEAIRLLPREARNRTRFLLVGGSEYPEQFFQSARGRLIHRLGIRPNYAAQAKELVQRYGLEDVIRFVDFWDDMPGLYDAIDVLVAVISRPAFEAAAAGKPVVAASSTGHTDVVVDEETGLLVPPGAPEALAADIGRLVEDGDLRRRLGDAGRSHARENFDYHRNGRIVMNLYDHLLEPKKDQP